MMTTDGPVNLLAIYTALLTAGIAASLHCIGMCGPILLGFAEVFNRTPLTIDGQPASNDGLVQPRRSLAGDFACYHFGRIWTYAMLGFGAGLFGQGIRDSGAYLGWQFPLSIVISATVIVSGVILLGVLPIGKVNAWLSGCGAEELTGKKWLVKLIHHRGRVARLLLGAVMGLLPCGMVYAVLLVVAAMPTPLHSATGMIIFGIGTLPSLTSVLLTPRLVPRRYRTYGSRVVAAMIIMAGSCMMARTWIVWSTPNGDEDQYPSCHSNTLDWFDTKPDSPAAQSNK